MIEKDYLILIALRLFHNHIYYSWQYALTTFILLNNHLQLNHFLDMFGILYCKFYINEKKYSRYNDSLATQFPIFSGYQ